MSSSESPKSQQNAGWTGALSDQELLKLNRQWYAEVQAQESHPQEQSGVVVESNHLDAEPVAARTEPLSDEELLQLNRQWYAELSKVHAQEHAEFGAWSRAHNKRTRHMGAPALFDADWFTSWFRETK